MSDAIIKTSVPFISDSENVEASAANLLASGTVYTKKDRIDLPRGADKEETESGKSKNVIAESVPHSMFSSYYALRNKKIDGSNYPLTDIEFAKQPELSQRVTAIKLVDNPRGASIYRPEDFLYTKNYGLVELNRLLTVRRFAFPCFDDIFGSFQGEPDVARLLAYSDQENNKLSEIMSFSCGMKWKDLTSSVDQMTMQGTQDGVNGFMRNVLRFVDPKFGQEALRGENELEYDPIRDQNRVYGPVDSIDRTYIRDVGLNFDQDFKIVFEYEMRSINGINQKTAFIDLLSNILAFATNEAKFWGGARYWLGPRPTKYMNDLRTMSPLKFAEHLKQSNIDFKGSVNNMAANAETGVSVFKQIINNAKNLALGSLLDKIGRPSIPYMNSLLTGNPVGLWHLTVGNPLNPMMVIGNLLLEDTTITFGNDLGIDEFPTSMQVECSFKHGMPRGRAEIESMFNGGNGRTYMKSTNPFGQQKSGSTISARTSSAIKPKHASDIMNMNYGSYFGDLNKKEIMHNSEAVWQFLK